MRKLILLSFVLIGCIPYKDYLANDDLCDFDDSIFTLKEDERYFDVVKYKSAIDSSLNTRGRYVLLDNDKFKTSIRVFPSYWISKKVLDKKNFVRKKIFYDSLGGIRSFYVRYKNNSDNIGVKIEFNEDSSIKKLKDNRKLENYPICYKEALAIVMRKKRKRDSITGLRKSTFNYRGKKYFVWKVFMKVPKRFGKGKSRYFNLDAQTGKILTKGIVVTVPAKFKD